MGMLRPVRPGRFGPRGGYGLHALALIAAIVALSVLPVASAQAQTLAVRDTPVAGSIVAAKGGEELQLVGEAIWRPALVRQDLVAGDTLRTGAIGNLAILFADATQIRVGRNSTLIVKATSGPVALALPAGAVWARASRGAGGVTIETPAATAAVRGTDWSLAVAPDGRTALAVFDGTVEFYNPQGSVSVSAGEAAVASIGGPPTKTVLVTPNDREQMLYYLELRDAFNFLPATPLDGPAARAERTRLADVPAAARGTEEWLAVAELALAYDGREAALDAVAAARRQRLSPAQAARADLVEAIAAGLTKDYARSAELFRRALPRLDGRRRLAATYGRYFAAALADPAKVADRPPRALGDTDPYGVIAEAWIAGFVDGPGAMLDVLRQGEKRFPDSAILPALRAQAAALVDARADIESGAGRAVALDAGDPEAIRAKAYRAAYIGNDAEAALADMRRAAAAAPGQSTTYNDIGLLESERDAPLEAEAALKRAIALDPLSPAPRANYAILLLDQNRLAEAKVQIDAAAALDPGLSAVYEALGRYELQRGKVPAAIEDLAAASAANPGRGNTLVALAAAYYMAGDIDKAMQQLETADRLDPFDPTTAVMRTLIALDHFEADEAIVSARDAARRYRAAGGVRSQLATTRKGGSYVADSFRFLGLDAWGRFYSDEAFDPFTSSSYFDEALAEQPEPFRLQDPLTSSDVGEVIGLNAFSSLMQGLLIDPLAASSRSRWTDPIRRPFFDPSLTGGLAIRDGAIGSTATLDVQAFANSTMPFAVSLNVSGVDSPSDETNDRFSDATGVLLAGATPTPNDRLVAFAIANRDDRGLPGSDSAPTPNDHENGVAGLAGAAWSHSFGYRNAVSAAVWGNDAKATTDYQRFTVFNGLPARGTVTEELRSRALNAALSHQLGLGPTTLRWGAEGSLVSAEQSTDVLLRTPGLGAVYRQDDTADVEFQFGRLYVDALYQPQRSLQAEIGAYVAGQTGDLGTESRFDPRIGLGVMPFEGHWLRAALRRDSVLPTPLTLAPVTTVGLLPNPLPSVFGGTVDSAIARWDAEWTERIFTAVEFQHQDVDDLTLDIPSTLATFPTTEGELDRISATLNVWFGYGFGGFASYAYTASRDTTGSDDPGRSLPFVPEQLATLGLAFADPSGFRVAVAETYVGERAGGGRRGRVMLDPYWTTDAIATWDSPDRHLQVGIQAINLLGADFDVADGVRGPGQTILATLTARF